MIDNVMINQIAKSIDGLLGSYSKEIEAAMAEEGTVSISLPLKIKENGPKFDVEVGIGFVKERVKDAVGFTVDGQKELFGPDGVDLEIGINGGDAHSSDSFGEEIGGGTRMDHL